MFAFSNGEIMLKDSAAVGDMRASNQKLNRGGAISSSPITACRWQPQTTPPATHFAVAHKDGKVYLYDRRRPDPPVASPTRWHTNKASRVSINSDSSSNPILCWQISPAITGAAVNAICFSRDGLRLAAASGDGRIWVLDVVHGYVIGSGITYFGKARCVCWSEDGHYLLSGGSGGDAMCCSDIP